MDVARLAGAFERFGLPDRVGLNDRSPKLTVAFRRAGTLDS